MIKEIRFNNYKAFSEGSLKVKPITLLLGTNSSGKSSILQLLLLIAQSVQSTDEYDGAFKLNGSYVALGESNNILHNKNEKNDFSMFFKLDKIVTNIKHANEQILRDLYRLTSSLPLAPSKDNDAIQKYTYDFRRKFTHKSRNIDDIDFIVEVIKKYKKIERMIKPTDNWKFLEELGATEVKVPDLMAAITIATELKTIDTCDGIEYGFFFDTKKNEFGVKKLSIFSGDRIIISYSNRRDNGYQASDLSSDFISRKILNKYRKSFGDRCRINGLSYIFNNEEGVKLTPFITNPVENLFGRLFGAVTRELLKSFQGGLINHVSPLRAYPQRYYMIDQSYTREVLNTKSGDSLADVLKRKTDVKGSVNKWLNKFNLTVGVEDVKDVIHSIKINQSGHNLDITDVGFGISQVLPVVVQGFLAAKNSITIIEQPEIHLHPKMQADLADLMIDIISGGKKSVIVETHSDALLKRLRRRIAEGVVPADDVAIYFITGKEKKSDSAKLEEIKISATGEFEWPKGFSETDIEDTLEFAKRQAVSE